MLWFAHGCASCKRRFPPPPSPSRSAAATRASWRCKSGGTACAPASSFSSTSGARTWPICRRRHRAACQGLQGQESRSAGDSPRIPAIVPPATRVGPVQPGTTPGPGSTFGRRHRAGNQQPERPRRSSPKALGPAACRSRPDPDQQGAGMADVTGGASGSLVRRDYEGRR
jgi:hypothetical protein